MEGVTNDSGSGRRRSGSGSPRTNTDLWLCRRPRATEGRATGFATAFADSPPAAGISACEHVTGATPARRPGNQLPTGARIIAAARRTRGRASMVSGDVPPFVVHGEVVGDPAQKVFEPAQAQQLRVVPRKRVSSASRSPASRAQADVGQRGRLHCRVGVRLRGSTKRRHVGTFPPPEPSSINRSVS